MNSAEDMYNSADDDIANIWGVNAQYAHPTGFEIGAGYYQIKSDMYGWGISGDGTLLRSSSPKNKIWSVNAGYNFSDKAKLWGSYARSDYEAPEGYNLSLASEEKSSWGRT